MFVNSILIILKWPILLLFFLFFWKTKTAYQHLLWTRYFDVLYSFLNSFDYSSALYGKQKMVINSISISLKWPMPFFFSSIRKKHHINPQFEPTITNTYVRGKNEIENEPSVFYISYNVYICSLFYSLFPKQSLLYGFLAPL